MLTIPQEIACPSLNVLFSSFKFLGKLKHFRALNVDLPMFLYNRVKLPIMAPKILKPEWKLFATLDRVCRRKDNRTMIRTRECSIPYD